jgi:hypothetical protein
MGRAIAQAVSRRLPPAATRVRSPVKSRLEDEVALRQVFSPRTSVSPANSHPIKYSIFIYDPGASTIGEILADVTSGLQSHLTKLDRDGRVILKWILNTLKWRELDSSGSEL